MFKYKSNYKEIGLRVFTAAFEVEAVAEILISFAQNEKSALGP